MLNNPLYKKYPRLAPTAEVYGFDCSDVELFLKVIENSSYRELIFCPELNLKALMVRLDVHKDKFEERIVEVFFKSLDEIRDVVGIQQVPLVFALYYKPVTF